MYIDVVIVNWNSGDHLRACLASIEALTQEEARSIRSITVVDNASTDGSADNLPDIPIAIDIIRNPDNFGFAVACNQGAQRGRAEFLLFLNPDTVLLTGALSTPLAFMSEPRGNHAGICGIQLLEDSGTLARSCSRFPTPGRLMIQALGLDRVLPNHFKAMSMREWDHSSTREVDQVIGAFFLVRRSLYDRLGGFDERFFVYFEEVDFSLRAKALGYTSMYLAGPKAIHSGHGSSRNIRARALFYNLRSRLQFAQKHFSFPGTAITWLFTLVVEPMARIMDAVISRSGQKARNTASAYRLLYGEVTGGWLHAIRMFVARLRARGLAGTFLAVADRVLKPRLRCYRSAGQLFADKMGLEIGGPSAVFRRNGLFPVYPVATRIDNCNFGHHTIWQGQIREGANFHYDRAKAPGRQHIAECMDLGMIPSASYDFVLASHVLEHTANPLRAITEWKRVLKEQGILMLVVPHKDGTFDHKRPRTTLAHLVDDFQRGMTERDQTHLPEILKLHDLSLDPAAGDFKTFRQRCENNYENRCIHHHVFDTSLLIEVMDYMGFQILAVQTARPYHIFVLAQRIESEQAPQNHVFMSPAAEHFRRSHFPSDRLISA